MKKRRKANKPQEEAIVQEEIQEEVKKKYGIDLYMEVEKFNW